jgi:16S rRNA (cytosine1402-N4)-methyltransferase
MHKPVMLDEVLQYLQPRDGEVYVDATFGAGGYTKAILAAANCKVIAIDQDPNAAPLAQAIKDAEGDRFEFIDGNFGDIAQLIKNPVDAIIFDIGVSSMQLDEAIRGFSFKNNGPLDMRMSQDGMSAADFLNKADEKQIADVIFQYGEERKSRHIAAEIVRSRPLETTANLASAVHRAIGNSGKTDSATKTFQAIRIFINSELENLQKGLKSALEILKKGGRLIVVSFHSLEDRIVKIFLQEKSGAMQTINRHMIQTTTYAMPEVNLLAKGAVKPSEQEIAANPRARSAKLRAAIKIGGYHD